MRDMSNSKRCYTRGLCDMSPFSPTHKRPIASVRGERDTYMYVWGRGKERDNVHGDTSDSFVLPAFRPRIYKSRGIGKIKFGQHFWNILPLKASSSSSSSFSSSRSRFQWCFYDFLDLFLASPSRVLVNSWKKVIFAIFQKVKETACSFYRSPDEGRIEFRFV